jgi:hypothetical protein
MPVDPVSVVIVGVVRGFIMPSQRRHLAKRRFVDTKGTDGGKRVLISYVITVDAMDVGGSVTFIKITGVAIVVDPVVQVPPEGQSVITVKVFWTILDIPRGGRCPTRKPGGETTIRVP